MLKEKLDVMLPFQSRYSLEKPLLVRIYPHLLESACRRKSYRSYDIGLSHNDLDTTAHMLSVLSHELGHIMLDITGLPFAFGLLNQPDSYSARKYVYRTESKAWDKARLIFEETRKLCLRSYERDLGLEDPFAKRQTD
jgi:hypothetical protein